MAPVMLPKVTRETEIEVRELSWAKDMKPTAGGKTQRQDRLGTRHAIRYDIPVLRYGWCGAGFAADLALGRTGEGVAISIPEPGLAPINYGANPTVNGAPQIGSAISVKGLTPGMTIMKGKWLSLYADGRYYAYFTTAQVIVPGSGIAVLPIYPMIRRSPSDNAPVLLADPKIQGLISEPLSRKLRRAGIGTIALSFEVEEQE